MCGLSGGAVPASDVEAALPAIAHRGPDGHGIAACGRWTLGHTRLAVQDLSSFSAQPYRHGATTVTYNGEMWAPGELPTGEAGPGDTPRVAALLDEHGPAALPMLRGMFALAWERDGTAYLARDTFGEVPLHYGWTPDQRLVWSSEISGLLALGAAPPSIRWVPPGHVLACEDGRSPHVTRWADPVDLTPATDGFEQAVATLAGLFSRACVSRMTADVPVAVLLSGGLDSAYTVAALVAAGFAVHPYLAVHYPGATDVPYARAVAAQFGLRLVEVPVPAPTRDALAEAVRVAELPHKAQVEITLACMPLAARIAADGFKVVLAGEGSDELWASYRMTYHGIQRQGWGPYRLGLFTGQHRKNFARVNKVFMAAGVEARMPFLDPPLARYALTLPYAVVTRNAAGRRHAKAVLAAAAETAGLPTLTAWRTKRTFQIDTRLDAAAAATVADPGRFYRAEFTTRFRGAPA